MQANNNPPYNGLGLVHGAVTPANGNSGWYTFKNAMNLMMYSLLNGAPPPPGTKFEGGKGVTNIPVTGQNAVLPVVSCNKTNMRYPDGAALGGPHYGDYTQAQGNNVYFIWTGNLAEYTKGKYAALLATGAWSTLFTRPEQGHHMRFIAWMYPVVGSFKVLANGQPQVTFNLHNVTPAEVQANPTWFP